MYIQTIVGATGHTGEVQGNPELRPAPTDYGEERDENRMYL